jgi:hypothetical protein
MKDTIIKALASQGFWSKLLTTIGFLATGGATVLDPHIAGYIGTAFIGLQSPVSKGVSNMIASKTSNYATTETKVDDIIHAATSAISKDR